MLKETVRNPNGIIMTSSNFTKQFFTTFKPDISGKYTVTIYNLGHTLVSIGVLTGNLPFVGANNQVNLNSFSGIIAGVILTITGIIILIAGVIVLILDRRRIRSKTHPST
jgi:sulfite exporter TauE/SafE